MSLLVDEKILTSTLMSCEPLILLNFWSISILNIFDWVLRGISVTSSINKIPPDAFSNAPYSIDPSFLSSPSSSISYFSESNSAPFSITNGSSLLLDFL